MGKATQVFERYEKKYRMNEQQYQEFMRRTKPYLQLDAYGKTTICNIYFDTKEDYLIRSSIEKPVYKEKLRLRTYGMPSPQSQAFVELKKKYKGVVYKRRVSMTYEQAVDWLIMKKEPPFQSQIVREIAWFLRSHKTVVPKVVLNYDRQAFASKGEDEIRVTIDENIQGRSRELSLLLPREGDAILGRGEYLMEIKVSRGFPLWLTQILDEEKIYPVSFSKYGSFYTKQMEEKKNELVGKYHRTDRNYNAELSGVRVGSAHFRVGDCTYLYETKGI